MRSWLPILFELIHQWHGMGGRLVVRTKKGTYLL